MTTIRTIEEVQTALRNQVAALTSSCAAYDKGDEWEAHRMATSAYVLLHDGGKKSRSVLTQLGLLQNLKYVSTACDDGPRNMLAWHPLVYLRIDSSNGGRFVPALADRPEPPSHVSFGQWWERDVIFHSQGDPKKRTLLTRKGLIYALRNKEGGSHFDASIDDASYIAMARRPIWFEVHNGNEQPLRGLETASMRQVAFELLETLRLEGLTAQIG